MSTLEAQMFRLHLRPPPKTSQEELPAPQEGLRRVASCAAAEELLGGGSRKRVQFADEMGLQLTRVRVIREPSWVPPVLPSHILARHSTEAASDSESGWDSETACEFSCEFVQPSSKYILFRENLEKLGVCLSSFRFEGRTAKGLISVRNFCFNKRLFIRATFNGWRSFQEFEATYWNSPDPRQDRFTFSFSCSIVSDFEFCVRFLADDQELWDNNGGDNYKVAARKRGSTKTEGGGQFVWDSKANFDHFDHVTDFSEYSAWRHHPDDAYY